MRYWRRRAPARAEVTVEFPVHGLVLDSAILASSGGGVALHRVLDERTFAGANHVGAAEPPGREPALRRRAPGVRARTSGAAYARPFEFGPKGNRVEARLGVALQQVVLGVKSSAQALREACEEIDRMTGL